MLNIDLDVSTGIAVVIPEGALSEEDFDHVVEVINPYIQTHGRLRGLLIYTTNFSSWDSFGLLIKNLKFLRNHHKKMSHVALVTDSRLVWFVDRLASHFTAARVRHFSCSDFDQARIWIIRNEQPWIS